MKNPSRVPLLITGWIVLAGLASCLSGLAQSTCAFAPSGMVGWWKGESNAVDAIGGNDGFPTNGVEFVAGEVGEAFAFNGTNSYVEVPDAPALRLTNELTIEFWVKRLRFDDSVEYCVEKGGDWTGGQQDYGVALNRQSFNYCLSFHFDGDWRGAGSIPDSNWHHCAVVARNGDLNPTFYIDGTNAPVVYNDAAEPMELYPSTRPLHLGAQVDPYSGWYYYGQELLDEVSIYNRALSASEIQAIYAAGEAGKCPPQPGPPVIYGQPAGITVTAGGTAEFSVGADGTPPPHYQWFFGSNPLADQTNSILVLTNVQSGYQGPYSATVSNAYGSSTSSNAILTVVNPPTCVAPPDGMVAWWRAESNLVDTAGINDLMSPSPSEIYGSPATVSYVTGKVGRAFSILGLAYQPAASALGAWPSASLNVGPGAGFTVEGWIEPVSSSATNPLLSWNDGLGHVGAGLTLTSSGTSRFLAATFTDTNSAPFRVARLQSPPLAISNLVWQHVALTFDHSNGLATLYWNGSPVAQTNIGSLTPLTQTPVYLGGGVSNPRLDEFSVYNRALSAEEIVSIFQADSAGKCVPPPPPCTPALPGIVGWWRGESNALDSVNGNTGVLTNAVAYSNSAVGACFRFAGGSITVPASSNLNVGAGPGFSVELWLNFSPALRQPFASFASFLTWIGSTNVGVDLEVSSQGLTLLQANLVDESGVFHLIRTPPNLRTAGGWQHVALTYDKASGAAALYLNGHTVTHTNLGSFTPRTTGNLVFARPVVVIPIGFGGGFSGLMDEIALYNRALTEAEIGSIFGARSSGKCAEPPTILTQPQSQTVNLGQPAVFNVVAEGTPVLHYQWLFNGLPVTNATDFFLMLSGVQTNDAGLYSVVVSNQLGVAVSSNAPLRVNLPPIADASATALLAIACNGSNATAILNGSKSSDPDGDALQYSWFEDGTALATGVVALVRLPLGTHAITLQVSDGYASNDAAVAVEVITTAQAVQRLIDQVNAEVDHPRPLVAILEATLNALHHDHCVAAIAELRAFQIVVQAQVGRRGSVRAAALNCAAEQIIQAVETCCQGHERQRLFPRIRQDHGRPHIEFPAVPGRLYLIEASDDLVHWEKIGVAIDHNDGDFNFEDDNPSQVPARFYRVVPAD